MDILQIKVQPAIEKKFMTWIDGLFTFTNDRTDLSYDYYINDIALSQLLSHNNFVCPFGRFSDEVQLEFIAQFTGHSNSSLYNKNVELYVCPECADSGCGVYSFKLHMHEDNVIWSDFIFETDYKLNEPSEIWEQFIELGPFTFDKIEYFKIFENLKP
ncbi:MAG: hypothetical protein KC646_05445 [Candidatus Cloacimonetes bacterium]|nr:hypothetical protein [Candidatus Cloacimonadota bacterium]